MNKKTVTHLTTIVTQLDRDLEVLGDILDDENELCNNLDEAEELDDEAIEIAEENILSLERAMDSLTEAINFLGEVNY